MNANQQREQLKWLYPGEAWAKKVDRMKDDQVAAVYLRLRRQNKL